MEKALPKIEQSLLGFDYGMYRIDYTRDVSGVLDRKTLVGYLLQQGFREQDDLCSAREYPYGGRARLHMGEQFSRRIHDSDKAVQQDRFPIGSKRDPSKFGEKLCEYVDCPSNHLPKTFLHSDVHERGCTRIEVSINACRGSKLSNTATQAVVAEPLKLVSQPDNPGVFVVQAPDQQRKNLASRLDR